MFEFVKDLFIKAGSGPLENPARKNTDDVKIATCALFLEMAQIDDQFSSEEQKTILSILTEKYGLSREHADALMKDAQEGLDQSIDLWKFASLINEHCSIDQKLEIIELLWRIVFVDGKMNRYEDYLMHKLTTLLRLTENQLITAKLKVLRENQS